MLTPQPCHDPETYNDALIFGDIGPDIMDRAIEISESKDAQARKPRFKRSPHQTFRSLLDSSLSHVWADSHRAGFLQGGLVDGTTKAKAQTMESLSLLAVTVEGDRAIDDLRRQIEERGLFAVIWTGSDSCRDSTIVYESELRRVGCNDPIAFLQYRRLFGPDVLQKATAERGLYDQHGAGYRVSHEPLRTYMVLFLLDRPFLTMEREGGHACALQEWRERFHGVSAWLDVPASKADSDPAKVIRPPVGSPDMDNGATIVVLPGAPLRLEDFDRLAEVPMPEIPESAKAKDKPKPANDDIKPASKQKKAQKKAPRKKAGGDGDDEGTSDALEAALKEFNREFAVTAIGGQTKVIEEPDRPGELPNIYSESAFKTLYLTRQVYVVDGDGGKKLTPVVNKWIRWPHRRTYSKGLIFEPDSDDDRAYNLWRGFPVEPAEGDWSLLREHIRENICQGNEEHYQWLMTWLAHPIQVPGTKTGSAVVLRGRRGTGKSKIFDWFQRLFGVHAVKASRPRDVLGQFNAHHAGKLLMVAEEAVWAGELKAQGVLKDMITSETQLVEMKGVDPVQTSNYMRLAFISNERHVVPASLGDERRFFVLDVGEGRMKDHDFFAAVDDQMSKGGLEAMMFDLQRWRPPEDDWNILRNPPRTRGLIDQGERSADPLEAFFLDIVKDGGREGFTAPGGDEVPGFWLNWSTPSRLSRSLLNRHIDHAVSARHRERITRQDRENAIRRFLKAQTRTAKGGRIILTPNTQAVTFGDDKIMRTPVAIASPLWAIRDALAEEFGGEFEPMTPGYSYALTGDEMPARLNPDDPDSWGDDDRDDNPESPVDDADGNKVLDEFYTPA